MSVTINITPSLRLRWRPSLVLQNRNTYNLPLFSKCLGISKILDGMLSHGFEIHDANLLRCCSFVAAHRQSCGTYCTRQWETLEVVVGAFNLYLPMYVSSKYSSKSSACPSRLFLISLQTSTKPAITSSVIILKRIANCASAK